MYIQCAYLRYIIVIIIVIIIITIITLIFLLSFFIASWVDVVRSSSRSGSKWRSWWPRSPRKTLRRRKRARRNRWSALARSGRSVGNLVRVFGGETLAKDTRAFTASVAGFVKTGIWRFDFWALKKGCFGCFGCLDGKRAKIKITGSSVYDGESWSYGATHSGIPNAVRYPNGRMMDCVSTTDHGNLATQRFDFLINSHLMIYLPVN